MLHKNAFSDEALFRFTPQYEASPVFISLRRGKPFHSDMKHSAYAPYDEKMKNERAVFVNVGSHLCVVLLLSVRD